MSIPWAIGDDCIPPSEKNVGVRKRLGGISKRCAQASVQPHDVPYAAAPLDLPLLMASAGVYPTLQVLYVPDYVPASARILATQRVAKKLKESFPDYYYSVDM